MAGDFNGDGIDDVVWYAPGGAQDYLWQGTVYGRFVGRQLTVNGDYTPVAGDFDGNGTDDILWYKPGGDRDDRLWRGKRNGSFVGSTVDVRGTFTPDDTGTFTFGVVAVGPATFRVDGELLVDLSTPQTGAG